MHAVRLCLALLVVVAPLYGWQSESAWTDAGSEDGIALAYRDDPQLNAREVRAIAELPHPAGRITSVVCDFTQTLDPGVREARILSGEIGGRYEVYLRYAPQYMVVSARDVVIDVRHSDNGCAWTEVADRLPSASGAVRMPLLRGSWAVEAIDPSRSRVTYQIAVRPGGSIPNWMVRRGALGALPDVISRASRCLSDPTVRDGRCPKPRD
ncbi:MAG TPA: hypothetical protein VNT81_20370 [Vicinamibacterales bacterium]|nr:hypothetical protein [Vicinamibacterales bacterium]